MTKQEIIDNFNNRWDKEGYREEIAKLSEIEKAMKKCELDYNRTIKAYFDAIDEIAEKFNQGTNTVVNDIVRL